MPIPRLKQGDAGSRQALAHRWHDAGNHVIITGLRQRVLNEAIAGREWMAAYVLDVTVAAKV
jgi:uncharacterized oxidoreductase